MDLYFDPPLYSEVGYEIVSKFPLAKEQVVLRLRHGYKWREEPGPLAGEISLLSIFITMLIVSNRHNWIFLQSLVLTLVEDLSRQMERMEYE